MSKHKSVAAKCEVVLQPEARLDPELAGLLRSYFSENVVEEFQDIGGVLTIGLSTDASRSPKSSEADKKFAKFLAAFAGDERELRQRLEPMTSRQLTNIARELNIPVRAKAHLSELTTAIISRVLSSKRWTGISGTPPIPNDADA